MKRQVIATNRAPRSPLYSQGVRVGNTVYVSGMVGIDEATNQLAGSSIGAQTRQAILNCGAVIEQAGGSLDEVLQVMVLLADPVDFDGMNEAYALAFPIDPPARAVATLGAVLPGVLVSIAMTAEIG
jgi:2-iminobutanoate/2-iminopropanoate deaminase